MKLIRYETPWLPVFLLPGELEQASACGKDRVLVRNDGGGRLVDVRRSMPPGLKALHIKRCGEAVCLIEYLSNPVEVDSKAAALAALEHEHILKSRHVRVGSY